MRIDDLALRVARRFLVSKLLTKEWLMAVRRGWLKLVDAIKLGGAEQGSAFRQLRQFLDNLEEQIRFTYRALRVEVDTHPRGKRYQAVVLGLQEEINRLENLTDRKQRDVVFYHRRVDSGVRNVWESEGRSGSPNQGDLLTPEETKNLGPSNEHWIAAISKKYPKLEEALRQADHASNDNWSWIQQGFKETAHKTLLPAFDKLMKVLYDDAREIKQLSESGQEIAQTEAYTEFDLNGVKVIIDDRKVSPVQAKKYVKYLDECHARMQAKGFGKMWYGRIFIECEACGGSNPMGKQFGVGGDYTYGKDDIRIYERPGPDLVRLLAHELGHRYWFKHMTQTQRAKFEDLVRVYKQPTLFKDKDPTDVAYFIDEAWKALGLGSWSADFAEGLKRLTRDLEKAEKDPPPSSQVTVEDEIASVLTHLWYPERASGFWGDSPPDLHGGPLATPETRAKFPKEYEEAGKARDVLVEHLKSFGKIPGVGEYEPEHARKALPLIRAWIEETWKLLAQYNMHTLRFHDSVERGSKPGIDPEDTRPVFPVSEYGHGNIEEAFAEVVSYFVIGKDLTRDQLESFRSVLASGPMNSLVLRIAARYQAAMIRLVTAQYKSKKKVKTQDGEDMTVYEYSDRQVANRNRKKAERIEKLRKGMTKLRSKIKKDLHSQDPEKTLLALAVALMDHTYERVGNDSSAKEGHFGVTGWCKKHVSFGGKGATIKYVGKSGVKHEKKITDPAIRSALKDAYEAVEGEDSEILSWDGGRVTADKVNDYLSQFDITAKDLRGLHANQETVDRLKAARKKGGKLPEDKKKRAKQLKDEFLAAVEGAAEAVGHEPSTLRSQYLVPSLEDSYLKDGTVSEDLSS